MPTLLLVDDEPALIKTLVAFFRRALPPEWELAAFGKEQEALAFIADDLLRDVRFCIVDIGMDGMGGAQLISEALKRRPDLRGRICVFSGSMLHDEDPLFTRLGCLRLDKPFEIAQLNEIVRSVTDG